MNYGTIHLKPENSYTIETSVNFRTDYFGFDLSLYSIWINDQILSIPLSPVQWSARNIGKTVSRGIECSLTHTMKEFNLFYKLQYAYKDASDLSEESYTKGKQLPYVPAHSGSLFLHWNHDNLALSAIMQYVGKRYSLQENTPSSVLDPVFLLTGFIEHTIALHSLKTALRFEIRNMLNTQYSYIINFPLPGRSYYCTMSFDFP